MGCGGFWTRMAAVAVGAMGVCWLVAGCAGVRGPEATASVRATIEEYGIYTNLVFAGRTPGNVWAVTGEEHVRTTTRVPFGEGMAFGFRFRLEGEPVPDAIDFGILAPPGAESSVSLHYRFTRTAAETRANPFVGYWFEDGEEERCGTWAMAILHDGRVLCEKRFEVVPPGTEAGEEEP